MTVIINRLWIATYLSKIILSHSLSSDSQIDNFISFFKEKFQSEIKRTIGKGQRLEHYSKILNNNVKLEYSTIGSSTIGIYKLAIMSCPINKVDKLLQLFADEETKLKIQKAVFETI